MAGVVFVFVREDASEAETLADAFDAAGYSIAGSDAADVCVVLWSRHAVRSPAFRDAAERVLRSGRAIVAGLVAPPPSAAVFDAHVVDLTGWDGADESALSALIEAAEAIAHPIAADAIILPSRSVYVDAEFTEAAAPLLLGSADAEQAEPKLGAPAPRRKFRRVGQRRAHKREYAALLFAVIALLGGGAFVASIAANTASHFRAEQVRAEMSGGVSLSSAQTDAIGLEDIAPEAQAPVGHRGVEPPSARTVHRVAYEP